jgi:CTP synthase
MVGSQFHPEFLSRPNAPHPLFMGLVRSAIAHHQARLAAQTPSQDVARSTAEHLDQHA